LYFYNTDSASLFLQQISYSESNSDATSDAEYNNVSSKDPPPKTYFKLIFITSYNLG